MKQLRRFPLLLIVFLALCAAPASSLGDLKTDIAAILQEKALRHGAVGIEIVRLGDTSASDQVLFQHKALEPRIPASNLKLITTAAALSELGPDFKFRTLLLMRGDDLVVVGDGDPTLGDAELLRKVNWGVTTVFETWAKQLVARKITSVNDVLVDDSVFDEVFVHPRWPADQEHKRYVAQVGGLNLNANCIDFYVRAHNIGAPATFTTDPATRYAGVRNTCVSGRENKIWLARTLGGNRIVLRGQAAGSGQVPVSVTIHDPPLFAATVLAETLQRGGVSVSGEVRRDRSLREQRQKAAAAGAAGWSLIGIHETPIKTVLERANKDSMNLYAESLCKRMGFAATGKPGSWENGGAAIGEYLKGVGVAESEFKLDDGSGLSRENLISPHALSRILSANYHSKDRQVFLDSLAIAGVDGTLKDRFKNSDLRGRVFGKSGYISGVRALSGYLKAKDGRYYAFSILMNRVPEDGTAKLLQERIVKSIDTHAATLAAGE